MDPQNEVVFVEPEQADSFELKGIRIDSLMERKACSRFTAYLVHMYPGQIKKASVYKSGEELYYVLSGKGSAKLGGRDYSLRQGCFFRVPPGTIHEFTTAEESLSMLNFHSPPVFPAHDTFFIE